MREMGVHALGVEWLVTWGKSAPIAPFEAEARLLAAFLHDNGCLPRLNKAA